jgi:hypothetical protein
VVLLMLVDVDDAAGAVDVDEMTTVVVVVVVGWVLDLVFLVVQPLVQMLQTPFVTKWELQVARLPCSPQHPVLWNYTD